MQLLVQCETKIDHFQDSNFHDIAKPLNLFCLREKVPPQYNNACKKAGVMPAIFKIFITFQDKTS